MKTSLLNTARESSRIVRNFGWDLRTSIFSVTLLTLSLFSSAALEQRAFSATPASPPRAFATAITGANAQLNGARLIPGATLFLGDVVKLGPDSSAAVQISGKNDQVIITPGTELVIAQQGKSAPSGKSPKTIYIISAAVGGAALGVGLWLSTQETVSPILP